MRSRCPIYVTQRTPVSQHLPRKRLMCGVWRGYDVAGVGGGEFALQLVLRQRVAPLYWRSDTHTHGRTYVLRVSSSQAINHPSSNNLELHTTTRHRQVLSVPSTSSLSAPSRYSLVLILLTPIVTPGWQAFTRRNLGFNHRILISKSISPSTELFVQKAPHVQSLPCASSPLKTMKC